MAQPPNFRTVVAALLIALGLLGAGWFASHGMTGLRTADRFVTVKGLAERTVDADLVVWPLSQTVGGDDLAAVQSQLDANTATIRAFLSGAGFPDDEVVVSPPRLEDRWAYSWGESRPPERYRYSNTVTLRTGRVAEAMEALRRSGQMVAGGVMLNTDEGGGPQFEFTRLNAIKPELIAEATANARASAEQFANDSGARIGGIRSANQGVISISDRDRGSPHVKTVRVVSTVEYFLKD
ncbi:SIMPL domain-containing protein [Luteimonas yindakuii]|uniref:SIMPL domain-containing protein n=1 Tax=Luteimonas yindakuii TaxID=2565782 RepID=A0A4Z1RD67_9GAMM|nr:SIMPL domain-containing protein [Luteimonas yindakuii]TKS54758.1 SIMPL domain-containing protein [Luteimonas yindakuii]